MSDQSDETEQLKHRINILEGALTQANRVREQWKHASEQLHSAQQSLKESHERFQSLFKHATNAVLVTDMDGVVQDLNAAAMTMFGYSESCKESIHIRYIFPDFETLSEKLHACSINQNTGLITRRDEVPLLRKDGSSITSSLSLICIQLQGELLLLFSVQDISHLIIARKQLESKYDKLEHEMTMRTERLLKLSQALECATEPVVIVDIHGVIEYANPAYFSMWGFVPSDLLGQRASVIKSGKQDDDFYKELWTTVAAGNVWDGRLINRCKNGQLKSVNLSISPVIDREKNISNFVGIYRDMTQQDYTEQQMVQSQKMEAVSTLVGGISHEFNNILASMTGNLYLAGMLYPNDEEMSKYLETAEQQGFKAAEIIQKLMVFARKDWVEEKDLELNKLLLEICTLGRLSVPENINFEYKLCSEVLTVRADASQIQQMLLHLVQNANDALGDSSHGKIKLTLEPCFAKPGLLSNMTEETSRSFAKITVQDNGIGIYKKDIPRIFEPFYTSKDTGEGTGLGLAAVFGVIERLGGTVDVHSKPGDTSFELFIPIIHYDQENQEVEVPLATQADAVEKKCILLVDDEPEVLTITAKILRSLHYAVIEVSNGLEAVQYYEQHSNEIDLVVSDIIMPELGGIDAVNRMRQVRENLPVIFMTGYDQEYFEKKVEERDNTRLILKPLRIGQLSKMIREILDIS